MFGLIASFLRLKHSDPPPREPSIYKIKNKILKVVAIIQRVISQ